jgi:hypothetical protein
LKIICKKKAHKIWDHFKVEIPIGFINTQFRKAFVSKINLSSFRKATPIEIRGVAKVMVFVK